MGDHARCALRPYGVNDVLMALNNKSAQVVDARPTNRFRGEAPEPRPGLRGGHMPGALNVPWGGLIHPDGTMKAGDDLNREIGEAPFEGHGSPRPWREIESGRAIRA